jgi:lysophospholipase L1-like esterase
MDPPSPSSTTPAHDPARSTRTRRVLSRAALILAAIYALIVVVTGRPLAALLGELAGVVTLWFLYAVRFAFDGAWAIAPEVWWLRARDRMSHPPKNAVVFIGSSTIAHWTTLATDLAPLAAVNHGINGARIRQLPHYATSLAGDLAPRAVVVYAGENDLAGFLGSKKRTPAEVTEAFRALCTALPGVPIFFLSIKPPKFRASSADAFVAANQLVREACAADARLHFVDIAKALANDDGTPREGIFDVDGVHLNDAGYRLLTSVVAEALAVLR